MLKFSYFQFLSASSMNIYFKQLSKHLFVFYAHFTTTRNLRNVLYYSKIYHETSKAKNLIRVADNLLQSKSDNYFHRVSINWQKSA